MRTTVHAPKPAVPSGRRPFAVNILYGLHIFLGLGALAGGFMLVADPSGERMQMPASMLQRSPFSDFLVPGLLLFTVFGLFPLLALYSMIRRPEIGWVHMLNPFKPLHSSWALSLYIGFGLIIWIMVQTYILNAVHIIHVVYMSLGLLIQIVTLWPPVQRYFILDSR